MRGLRGIVRETAGGLPRQYWYVWGATLVNRAGSFVIIFLAIYLTTRRGFSPALAGLAVGLYSAGGSVGVTIGGTLADRWGRRPTLLLAYGAGATCMVLLGFCRQPLAILAVAGALGTASEMARPPLGAMIADLVPGADRLRAYSVYYWAINLGFSCSAILAGYLASVDYLLLFLGDAATTLVAGVLIATRLRETRPVTAPVDPDGERPVGGLRTVLRDRVFLGFLAANLLTSFVFLQHMSTLPIAMQRDGLSPRMFGLVIAMNGVLIVLGQFVVTRILKDRRPTRVLVVAAIVFGLGFGLTAFAHTPIWYAVTVLVWTVGEMFNAPAVSSVLAQLSPVSMRGRYQGAFSLSWQVAGFAAPVIGGFIQSNVNNTTLWLVCLAAGLTVAALHLVGGPARERRAALLDAVAVEPVT